MKFFSVYIFSLAICMNNTTVYVDPPLNKIGWWGFFVLFCLKKNDRRKRSEIKFRFLYILQLTFNQQHATSSVLTMLATGTALALSC